MSDTGRPFIAAAFFCENILTEAEKVTSAIRIVDTYTLSPIPPEIQLPEESIRGVILLKGMITVKSDVPVAGNIHLIMNRTTGERVTLSPPDGWPADLKGDHGGATILLNLPLGVKNFGVLWFDVLWNDRLLTRIPLKLQQGEAPQPAPDERPKPDAHG